MFEAQDYEPAVVGLSVLARTGAGQTARLGRAVKDPNANPVAFDGPG